MMVQIFSGLRYLAQQRVIHYDLKPANIIFDGLGQAKIADFGLSKVGSSRWGGGHGTLGSARWGDSRHGGGACDFGLSKVGGMLRILLPPATLWMLLPPAMLWMLLPPAMLLLWMLHMLLLSQPQSSVKTSSVVLTVPPIHTRTCACPSPPPPTHMCMPPPHTHTHVHDPPSQTHTCA